MKPLFGVALKSAICETMTVALTWRPSGWYVMAYMNDPVCGLTIRGQKYRNSEEANDRYTRLVAYATNKRQ